MVFHALQPFTGWAPLYVLTAIMEMVLDVEFIIAQYVMPSNQELRCWHTSETTSVCVTYSVHRESAGTLHLKPISPEKWTISEKSHILVESTSDEN